MQWHRCLSVDAFRPGGYDDSCPIIFGGIVLSNLGLGSRGQLTLWCPSLRNQPSRDSGTIIYLLLHFVPAKQKLLFLCNSARRIEPFDVFGAWGANSVRIVPPTPEVN